jgi:hypothetical protein
VWLCSLTRTCREKLDQVSPGNEELTNRLCCFVYHRNVSVILTCSFDVVDLCVLDTERMVSKVKRTRTMRIMNRAVNLDAIKHGQPQFVNKFCYVLMSQVKKTAWVVEETAKV